MRTAYCFTPDRAFFAPAVRAIASLIEAEPDVEREIVLICEPDDVTAAEQRLDDVVRYLARHRINAIPRVVLREEGSPAAQLSKLAHEEGADLIVTGAYGHSRLGEWIFGGVTRDLLAASSICCLMSH